MDHEEAVPNTASMIKPLRKTGIVVPCYNEAHRLNRNAFVNALNDQPDLFFLFIDDGSSDSTMERLESIRREKSERVGILGLKENSGKAEAVRRGILELVDMSFEYVGYWDADLATPLDEIREFSHLLDTTENSIIIGSRVKLLGRNISRNPARHYFGRVFATFASLLLRIGVYDTQCGAKMFKNSPLLRKVFAIPFKVNWTFDVEMLARFQVLSGETPLKVCSEWYEYPLKTWIDVEGSKVRSVDFLVSAFEFCKLFSYLYTPARINYKNQLEFGETPGLSP